MATLEQEMDDRFTSRVGRLLVESEKRAVAAEVERDYYRQQVTTLQEVVARLEAELATRQEGGDDDGQEAADVR